MVHSIQQTLRHEPIHTPVTSLDQRVPNALHCCTAADYDIFALLTIPSKEAAEDPDVVPWPVPLDAPPFRITTMPPPCGTPSPTFVPLFPPFLFAQPPQALQALRAKPRVSMVSVSRERICLVCPLMCPFLCRLLPPCPQVPLVGVACFWHQSSPSAWSMTQLPAIFAQV